MELAGKVIAVLEARSGQSKTTGSTWMTQEYVIETHEEFPHRMCFNVFGEDKIKLFNIQVGEELNVSFDVNAREWQGRWFNDLRAWKVERVQTNPSDPQPAPAEAAPQTAAEEAPVSSFEDTDGGDDLPF